MYTAVILRNWTAANHAQPFIHGRDSKDKLVKRSQKSVSGIRYQVSYLDWGTFSHRLFLQAPSKQKGKEKSTKQRQRSVKWESIGSSIVSQLCSIKIN